MIMIFYTASSVTVASSQAPSALKGWEEPGDEAKLKMALILSPFLSELNTYHCM